MSWWGTPDDHDCNSCDMCAPQLQTCCSARNFCDATRAASCKDSCQLTTECLPASAHVLDRPSSSSHGGNVPGVSREPPSTDEVAGHDILRLQDASAKLQARELAAGFLHGEMSKEDRASVLKQFRLGQLRVLVVSGVPLCPGCAACQQPSPSIAGRRVSQGPAILLASYYPRGVQMGVMPLVQVVRGDVCAFPSQDGCMPASTTMWHLRWSLGLLSGLRLQM